MSIGLLVPSFSIRQFHSSYTDFIIRSNLFQSYLTISSSLSDTCRRYRERPSRPLACLRTRGERKTEGPHNRPERIVSYEITMIIVPLLSWRREKQ